MGKGGGGKGEEEIVCAVENDRNKGGIDRDGRREEEVWERRG